MRRLLATLLLACFSLALWPVALFADDEANLPACCKKNGKHKCAMSTMDDDAGPLFKSERCPDFPNCLPSVSGELDATPVTQSSTSELVVQSPAPETQADTQYRISCERSRQKRGPPSFLPYL